MYKPYNPNPKHARVGDCVIRALSKALNQTWDETYISLCDLGLQMADMPSANHVWGEYLKEHGFWNEVTSSNTVSSFARKNIGKCVLALSGHVVAVVDHDWYDTWDSGDEAILYVWRSE